MKSTETKIKKFKVMAINIKPLGERVVVKPMDNETKTASGIYIPDTAKEKQNRGKVVAVGKIEDNEIKKGDVVLYSKYSGTEVEFEDEKYLILDKNDVLAII